MRTILDNSIINECYVAYHSISQKEYLRLSRLSLRPSLYDYDCVYFKSKTLDLLQLEWSSNTAPVQL